ncbi:MAG: hypothetical protein ACI88A_001949 [Paraglaciecola sp.]|jgi:uncharacterized protein YifE (UPF0438 family)
MAKLTREFLLKRAFSDPKNYPYGFSRSGDFSISESQALGQYGCLVAALLDGQLESVSEEDYGLLESAYGKKEPQTIAEKAWVKYQKRINRPKPGTIYGTRPIAMDVDDDTESDSDDDFEIDDDD